MLNHLALLDRLGMPHHCVHVYFGATSLSRRNTFTTRNLYHDPIAGDNVWEYFFERLGGKAKAGARCPDPATAPAVQLDNDSLSMLHEVGRR